jgi:hypothetical protein
MKRKTNTPTPISQFQKISTNQMIPNELLCNVFSFLPARQQFTQIPLLNSTFNSVSKSEYDWYPTYKGLLAEVNINVNDFKRKENFTGPEYLQRIKTKVSPLFQQRKRILGKIAEVQQSSPIRTSTYTALVENVKRSLTPYIEFTVQQLQSAPYVGASRFCAPTYDVPVDRADNFTDDLCAQFDFSVLKDTFCSNLHNLPESGYLYVRANDMAAFASGSFYRGNDLEPAQPTGDEDGQTESPWGYIPWIIGAVDVLELPPNEDFDYFENEHDYRESDDQEDDDDEGDDDEGDKEEFIELIRGMKSVHSKDRTIHSSVQMFGTPYYTQHYSDGNSNPLLLMYYSNGGDLICYIHISETDLERRQFEHLQYGCQT